MALSSIDICSSSSPHLLALSPALSLPSSPEHPFMPKFHPSEVRYLAENTVTTIAESMNMNER